MAENENIAATAVKAEAPQISKGAKFKAGLKERFRKFIVKLKIKPQIIPLFFMLISSLVFLLGLRSFSVSISEYKTSILPASAFGKEMMNFSGLCIFVNTLFSLLVLMLMLWSFPKRKKPNKVMLVLTFVFMAVLIVMDIMYYLQMYAMNNDIAKMFGISVNEYLKEYHTKGNFILSSFTVTWVHIAFVGVTFVLLATLPLYKKLLRKINTKKAIESTQLKEEIDTSAEV